MKIINKDKSAVYIQKRDIKYLANIAGFRSFDKYANNITAQNEQEFIRITEQNLVEGLRFRDDIIDYFDYLQMDMQNVQENLDQAYEAFSLYQKENSRKKRRDSKDILFLKKMEGTMYYRYSSLLEIMLDNFSSTGLLTLPICPDQSDGSYHVQTDKFLSFATEVEGLYIFRRQDGKPFDMEMDQFMNFFVSEQQQILANTSTEQKQKKQLFSIETRMPEDKKELYMIVQPKVKKKVYEKK